MDNNILEYFAETRSGYLHAHGKLSTPSFVKLLDCQMEDKVLEIGFGTGTTLIQMNTEYPNTKFFGIDRSKAMFEAASKRIQFCGQTENIELKLHSEKTLPFTNHTFDRIYIESVLAIQEGELLSNMLQEIKRILKPNGILLFNETIWLESTNINSINQINDACKRSFGIIQANGKYPYLKNWIALLEEVGFSIESTTKSAELIETQSNNSRSLKRSRWYSLKGSLKSKLNPRLRRQWKRFINDMERITDGKEQLMEGIIIQAIRKTN